MHNETQNEKSISNGVFHVNGEKIIQKHINDEYNSLRQALHQTP